MHVDVKHTHSSHPKEMETIGSNLPLSLPLGHSIDHLSTTENKQFKGKKNRDDIKNDGMGDQNCTQNPF